MRFDLRRLRLLHELANRGTMEAVAQAMSYTPAAVSQQLAVLQREVGVRLFYPDGRGVRLTPQAWVLVGHAEAVLGQLERAEADLMRSLLEVSGTIRIAAFQTALLTLIPAALGTLRTQHPSLRIEVVQAESVIARSALLPRDIDLVIDEVYPGYPLARSDHLRQHVLLVDPLRVAHTAQHHYGTDLSAYSKAPWVMEPPGSPAREWAILACREAGFEPDIVYESTDVVVHARLVESTHAVAFLPDLMVTSDSTLTQRTTLRTQPERRIVTTIRASAAEHPATVAAMNALRVAAEAARQPATNDR